MIGSGPFGIPVLRQLRTLHRETERINHKRCDWRGQCSFGLRPHCLLLPCPLSVYCYDRVPLYTVSVLLWPCHFACIPSVYYYDRVTLRVYRQCTIMTVSLCLNTVSVLLWPCHFVYRQCTIMTVSLCIPSVYWCDRVTLYTVNVLVWPCHFAWISVWSWLCDTAYCHCIIMSVSHKHKHRQTQT